MSTVNVVLGALAGLAIGATAGILFAPKKGSTTRKQIMDKGDDYLDELTSRFDKFSDPLTEIFDSTEKDAEGLAGKRKAKYDDAKRDLKNATPYYKQDSAAGFKHTKS